MKLFNRRSFSDLQGKYGRLMEMPHIGSHKYDPRKMPKLFSEVEEIKDMETMLDEMLLLVSSSSSRESLKENLHNVSAPMPEGHFKIERKVYQSFLEKSKHGDMSYLRLQNN